MNNRKSALSVICVGLAAVMLVTAGCQRRTAKNTDYYRYIKSDLKIMNTANFTVSSNETGVFSAVIKDFDADGVEEMITFSIMYIDSSRKVFLDLYKITGDSIVHCNSSKGIFVGFSGNGTLQMCAVAQADIIRIYNSASGLGGSTNKDEFLSYKVQNNKLVLRDDFDLNEFYRNDTLDYSEKVTGKTYQDSDSFYDAVVAAGYDRERYYGEFTDDYDAYFFDKSQTVNHIYTMYQDEHYSTSGSNGAIYNFGVKLL